MAKNISVPDIGDFKDVEIIEVLVKPGDQVKKNDPIRTSKNILFSAHRAGALESVFYEMGEIVFEDLKLINKGLPPKLCRKAELETVGKLRSKPVKIN